MKKILISIGSLLIMAAIVVLFVNANDSKKDTKKAKAKAEVEAAAPCCAQPAAEAANSCDPAKCKEVKDGKCDPATCTAHKEGKCDPATCTAHKEGAVKEAEACNPTAACPATCPMKTAALK
jgi:hypothetical protein